MFYVRIVGYLPCRITWKSLVHAHSPLWRIYSIAYAILFVFAQLYFYWRLSYDNWGRFSFRRLIVLTKALSYCSVLLMTTSIMLHHLVKHRRIFSVSHEIFGVIHHVAKYNLNGTKAAQQIRTRLMKAFLGKALYFELCSFLLFTESEGPPGENAADVGVKSNLWLINMMTTVYVGALLVIIYHFKMLGLRVAAVSDELRRSQLAKKTKNNSSINNNTYSLSAMAVDLSFRYCDDIDEIAVLHRQLRRLTREVQCLFQPLLLLVFAYHWCDFIIQAYLWYFRYTEQGSFQLITLSHYLATLLIDLVDVVFLCAAANETTNAAAETGLMLQKFNAFEMDPRLDTTVSVCVCELESRRRQSDDNARNG